MVADPAAEFMRESLEIIESAQRRGVIIRLMGALAIKHHCPKFESFFKILKRDFSDIDVAGYQKQKDGIVKVLEELGYKMRLLSYSFVMGGRLIFINEQNGRHLDVFLDELNMCHRIDFKGRLEVDFPTIPLAELLLEKMQIVKLGEKDIKDTIILIREHDLGYSDDDLINVGYVAELLSKDWGFYYTVTTNLRKVKNYLQNYEQLKSDDKSDVATKIDKIIETVEKEPKSLSWKMRARIGPSVKWYRDVDTPKV